MNLNPLAKPSVTSAVRNLENALTDLEKAQHAHEAAADAKAEEAARLFEEADAEARNAARAERIRTKLADLLA